MILYAVIFTLHVFICAHKHVLIKTKNNFTLIPLINLKFNHNDKFHEFIVANACRPAKTPTKYALATANVVHTKLQLYSTSSPAITYKINSEIYKASKNNHFSTKSTIQK
jgi:hypothetical protein